jgi:hypothetical protein
MATLSADALPARDALPDSRRGVPWKTVVTLAAVLAYADGYWLVSLRGAIGAIERTDHPFASWLRESTAVLPVFVFAVLAALTLALRWFAPKLGETSTVVATALVIVVCGTLVAVAALVASAAYDYHLESAQLQVMQGMSSMHGHCDANCLAHEDRDTLALQVRGVLLVSRWILLTNVVLVAWVVAIMGGRLKLSTARRPQDVLEPEHGHRIRVQQVRLLLVGALVGSAAIHAAVIPEHLAEWTAAGLFFILLSAGELAVAGLLLARVRPRTALLAAATISVAPLLLWLYSRTAGLPFGPEAGTPESVGVPDILACSLEVGSLLAALALLRSTRWLAGRSPASSHVHGLVVVALVCMTVIGVGGSGLSWFDAFGTSASHSATGMHH